MASREGRERTLTSKVGISNRKSVGRSAGPPVPARPAGRWEAGFTLFELVVVLFILSLISLVVFPKLEGFLAPDLSGTSRHLIATIRSLHDEAEVSKQIYRLNYDLDAGVYWSSMVSKTEDSPESDPAMIKHVALPDRIRFQDIVTLHQGKVSEGKAFTQFYPSGRVEKTLIHLALDKDQVLTLIINPLTGAVKVYDHYIEEEEKSQNNL
jgi:general secretion pathway protein H